jgi:hypothetical protein
MPMKYKAEDLDAAPMLSIFGPLEALPWEKRGGFWDLFEISGDVADAGVGHYTDDMKVWWLPVCPQMDDSVPVGAMNDTDAAVFALHDGFYLIKLPDKQKSKHFRFYVVDRIGTWKTPLPRDVAKAFR